MWITQPTKCAYLKISQPQFIVCWYKVFCSITKAFSRHFGESESEFISTHHTTLRFLGQFYDMAPRKKTRETDEEDTRETPKLFNVAGKGLGYFDKYAKVIQVSDVSLKLVGR